MDINQLALETEEMYHRYSLLAQEYDHTGTWKRHYASVRVHLLQARIEIEKCKWLETIARKISSDNF